MLCKAVHNKSSKTKSKTLNFNIIRLKNRTKLQRRIRYAFKHCFSLNPKEFFLGAEISARPKNKRQAKILGLYKNPRTFSLASNNETKTSKLTLDRIFWSRNCEISVCRTKMINKFFFEVNINPSAKSSAFVTGPKILDNSPAAS